MNDLWQRFVEALRENLAPPLNRFFSPLDDFLGGLSPEVGRWCAAALLASAGVWVLFLKRDYIFLGAPDRHWWRDLRIWTLVALAPYICIYLFMF